MRTPLISIICACSENRAIGENGKIPWLIHEDLKHFKLITEGYAVIMGRKTFESIGKPLPKRTNIVITRDKDFVSGGIVVVHSIEEALEKARQVEKEEIFIIGGGQIYSKTIPMADKLYLTIVEGNFDGDTFFPDYSEFKKVVSKRKSSDKNFKYTFLELEK